MPVERHRTGRSFQGSLELRGHPHTLGFHWFIHYDPILEGPKMRRSFRNTPFFSSILETFECTIKLHLIWPAHTDPRLRSLKPVGPPAGMAEFGMGTDSVLGTGCKNKHGNAE